MPSRLLDRLRHETRFVIHISTRDLAKNLSAFGMIAAVCWIAGARTEIVVLAAVVISLPVALQMILRAGSDKSADLGNGRLVALWLIHVASTVTYLWPAIILADQPSVALLLGGFMWLFGVYVHVSNTYVSLPLYNWSQMVPAFAVAIGVFWTARDQQFQASVAFDWWLAAAMMVIYAVNTFETMNKQKDTQAQLDAARAEALARLHDLEHMTRHDPLTGLMNRAAFDDGLARMLARRKDDWHVAVFLIDLDGFKPINDTYGHEAGDGVLAATAARLADLAGAGGIVARLGGDEFALAADSLRSERAALWLSEQILREIRKPIEWHEKSLSISASIGIGLSGPAGDTVSEICAAADQAMYRAKGSDTRAVAYRPDSFPRRLTFDDRQALVDALRSAEIRPHYQPKVRLSDGALVGIEALARWVHPVKGVLAPAAFLRQINDLGLQGDFMTTITGQVLRDIDSLVAEGLDPGRVSVNMPEIALATESGRADLYRLLALYPRAGRSITLEITEDVFISRAGNSIQAAITAFRSAGLRVSLDDFGTGFASFQHLRQMEFDELKIAPAFVADLGRDRAAEVLVKGFLDIACGLRVDVIAEGVETEDQRRILVAMGCETAQGHLFGRARPLDETRMRLMADAGRGAAPPPGPAAGAAQQGVAGSRASG